MWQPLLSHPDQVPFVRVVISPSAAAMTEYTKEVLTPQHSARFAVSQGYALTDGEGNERCLKREGDAASVVPCAESSLALTFTLLSDAEISAMGSTGTRMCEAAAAGDGKLVKQMLKEGAPASSADWEEMPVLSAAASAGHLDIVKLLISKVRTLYCCTPKSTRGNVCARCATAAA